MKYKASWDSVPTPEERPFAVVQAGTAASSEALALRHARAMLEVQRAARAFARARKERSELEDRIERAVARLERIEKEVRGV